KPGASPNTPGSYSVDIGIFHNPGSGVYRLIPVTPELSRQAAELLTPSPAWCAHANVTCAGVEYDARLPLENSLSEDGDAEESSWRHFLALAAEGAEEADGLGESVMEEGLKNDLRAEVEVSRLEEHCGG